MRVGYCLFPQNAADWERFEEAEHDPALRHGPARSDAAVLSDQFALADQVEGLGFDSIWSVEHHFAPYTMITNPLQALTYFAGRTERVDLGTCVVVLPWHHPVRVAEDAVLLQHLLGPDRQLLLGVGRGLGRREFGGFGVDMNESRGRFSEAVEIIQRATTQEFFSYEGQHYQVPERSLRPLPLDARIAENMHCAWGSPQSVPIAADLGLKPLVVPQKPWAAYREEIDLFESTRAAAGRSPASPRILVYMYCAATMAEAEAGARKHYVEYADTALRQYELLSGHFSTVQGYEHYAASAEAAKAANAGAPEMASMFLDNHIWGTPDECIAKIDKITHALDVPPEEIVVAAQYGTMTFDDAQRSLRLFAQEVLPAVHDLG